jgi:four helix bundle protein
MSANNAYRTFEDLEVYRVARGFRKAMYGVTRKLPDVEKFDLGSQIRRAAVSLTNNISEGHGRYHYLDQIRFCLNARGSLEELLDDLNICLDESYLPEKEIVLLQEEGWSVHRLLNGYIRWLRQQKQGSSLALHEDASSYGRNEDQLEHSFSAARGSSASTL